MINIDHLQLSLSEKTAIIVQAHPATNVVSTVLNTLIDLSPVHLTGNITQEDLYWSIATNLDGTIILDNVDVSKPSINRLLCDLIKTKGKIDDTAKFSGNIILCITHPKIIVSPELRNLCSVIIS